MTYREKYKELNPEKDASRIHIACCPDTHIGDTPRFRCPFPPKPYDPDKCRICWDMDIPGTEAEEAIRWYEDEISHLKAAPRINGCNMRPEWETQIKIHTLAIAALRAQQELEKKKNWHKYTEEKPTVEGG